MILDKFIIDFRSYQLTFCNFANKLKKKLLFIVNSITSQPFSIANEPHPEIIGIAEGLQKIRLGISAIMRNVLGKAFSKHRKTSESST